MYQNASSRKLKIFSQTEIKSAKGLEKVRRQFWNNKGEELCRDKTLKTWTRTALQGVIDRFVGNGGKQNPQRKRRKCGEN